MCSYLHDTQSKINADDSILIWTQSRKWPKSPLGEGSEKIETGWSEKKKKNILASASKFFRGAPLGDVLAIFYSVSILNRYHLHFGKITCNYHLQIITCICSPSPKFGGVVRSCSGFRGVVRNLVELSGISRSCPEFGRVGLLHMHMIT